MPHFSEQWEILSVVLVSFGFPSRLLETYDVVIFVLVSNIHMEASRWRQAYVIVLESIFLPHIRYQISRELYLNAKGLEGVDPGSSGFHWYPTWFSILASLFNLWVEPYLLMPTSIANRKLYSFMIAACLFSHSPLLYLAVCALLAWLHAVEWQRTVS